MFRRREKISITPKGRFVLYMIGKGYAKTNRNGYDVSAICQAWEEGKKAFANAVRNSEELKKLLPHTVTSAGCATTVDVTEVLRALEDAFGEPFTSF